MLDEERTLFGKTLASVCGEMLTGTTVQSTSNPGAASAETEDDKERVFASVGLAGPNFRGSLSILGTPAFFRSVYPPELGKTTPEARDLDDWACEITNQLLGRFKNQLARLGLDFGLSTPTVVRGKHLHVSAPSRPVAMVNLRQDRHVAHVFLEITHEDGHPLLPPDGKPTEASLEGEGGLF